MSVYNYNILNTKDFYNDIFIKNIEGAINKNKVNVKDTIFKTNVTNESKTIHNERMIKMYMIPLMYLIYSFIYIKFYKDKRLKNAISTVDLDYNMYGFVFDHKNPIIKKVNIFLHKKLGVSGKNNPKGGVAAGELFKNKSKKKKVKEGFSNWRNDLAEVMTDVEAEKKVEEKKNIKNKIKINQ